MPIAFQCTKCDARIEVDAEHAGGSLVCPTCGLPQVVPRQGLGPGTVVGGFEIVRLIGRGGMGEVYLARQRSLDRMVALKVLSRYLAPGRDAVDRFIREIRLTARLEHPYLVTAFEGGEGQGIVYLAMAYVRGASLHERVIRRGPLTEAETLALGRKIASALNYAWDELRLLHRDIKPSNILLDAHGEPRLADLGLAKCLGQREGPTMAGAVLGTPNYMSPEQADGRDDLDVRSDIYSLGATLYTACTGQIPYQAGSLLEVLRRQATEPLPDPRTYAPQLSAEFVEFLGRFLARDRRERPRDWPSALAEFDRLLVRHPGPAGILPIAEETATPPPTPPASWRRTAVIVIPAFVALIGGALTGWWWMAPRPSAPPPSSPSALPPAAPHSPLPAPAPPGQAQRPAAPPEWTEPAEADLQSPGRPPLSLEARRQLVRAWMEARDVMRRHPDDLEGQLARIDRVIALAPESPIAQKVREWVAVNRIREKAEMRRLEREFERAVEEDLAAGRFEEGIRRLQTYSGPLEKETRELRAAMVRRLEEGRENHLRREAARLFSAAIGEAAVAGAAGRWSEAASALERARADPAAGGEAERLAEAVAQAARAANWGRDVLSSFQAQRGQTVEIEFADGHRETLQVARVTPTEVVGRRYLPEGFVERTVTCRDLSLRERLRRLGQLSAVEIAFLEGVWLLESRDRARAAAAFAATGTPLGEALARQLAGGT